MTTDPTPPEGKRLDPETLCHCGHPRRKHFNMRGMCECSGNRGASSTCGCRRFQMPNLAVQKATEQLFVGAATREPAQAEGEKRVSAEIGDWPAGSSQFTEEDRKRLAAMSPPVTGQTPDGEALKPETERSLEECVDEHVRMAVHLRHLGYSSEQVKQIQTSPVGSCLRMTPATPPAREASPCPECEAEGETCEYHEVHATNGDVAGFPWDKLPGFLIDHYEGEILTEELLQQAVAEMSRPLPLPPTESK